jgi:hypothetical protein
MFFKKNNKLIEPVKVKLTIGESFKNRVNKEIRCTKCKTIKGKACYFDNDSMIYSINSSLVLAEEFYFQT